MENETIAIGGPAGIAALVSGDVDFSGAGGSGLRGAVRGAPVKAIFYQTEKPTWYLFVHPSITQGADLRGKKIGVALLGDSEDRFDTLYAERAGVPAKDLTRLSLGTSIGDKILGVKTARCRPWFSIPPGRWRQNARGCASLSSWVIFSPCPFKATSPPIKSSPRIRRKSKDGFEP